MPDLRFDPSKAINFDLARGLVHQEGAQACLLVPAGALGALALAAGPDAARAFGRALGEAIGRRVAARVEVGAASVASVVEHLGGELALAGLGSLGVERWGHALVLVVDQSPLAVDAVLEAALTAALSAASGRPVHAALLAREGERARFLVASEPALAKVRRWLAEGHAWGDVLVRLHAPEQRNEGGEA